MSKKNTISEVVQFLQNWTPPAYQENYDNSGLITGDLNWEITGALITLDCTEDVVKEAVENKCNLIVAHHPILFKPIKKLTGNNYVERTIIQAIRNNIAIYAIHTNLDNVKDGVNKMIGEKLGLSNLQILVPKRDTLLKLVTFIPKSHTQQVLDVIHQAGAGQIGEYKNCSFTMDGTGAFNPTDKAKPFIGSSESAEKVNEDRIEVIVPRHREHNVLAALRKAHPYEEVAYYLSEVINENQEVGSGMIGDLNPAMESLDFLHQVKKTMAAGCIRHTNICVNRIKKVAICGGAGSFLIQAAKKAGADALISADFKYHEFFDADNQIILADIGHFESEQFTKDLLRNVLQQNFVTFASIFSKTITNPISYI